MKTICVTGATSGIGLEAAVVLARTGARMVLVGRDAKKLKSAADDVRARGDAKDVFTLTCDFSSQQSIRAFCEQYKKEHDRLDVLINNAGTVNKARTLTVDGIEHTFAVNHLGYFLTTNLLLDVIKKSAPARIVHTASVGHRRGTMDFDDLGFERGYFIMKAYSRSKLGNVLFSNELARRLAGSGVTSNALHPGAVATNIWSGAPGWSKPLLTLFARPFFISSEKGGATLVHAAIDPSLEGVTGKYFEKMKAVDPSPLAQDQALAKKLWDVSAQMVGL
jgi:retinol dehydrogenase 14